MACLKKRFHVVVRLFSDRSLMTSKCGLRSFKRFKDREGLTLRASWALYCCRAISSCTHCGTSGITSANTNLTPSKKCCNETYTEIEYLAYLWPYPSPTSSTSAPLWGPKRQVTEAIPWGTSGHTLHYTLGVEFHPSLGSSVAGNRAYSPTFSRSVLLATTS